MNLAGAACAAPVFFLSMENVGSPGKNRIAEMKQQEKEARGGTPGFSVLIVLMV